MRQARLWIFLVTAAWCLLWELPSGSNNGNKSSHPYWHSALAHRHDGLHERPMVDALNLAIEEINQSGGLLESESRRYWRIAAPMQCFAGRRQNA